MKLCAEKGGVIGLCPLSMFVSNSKSPSEIGVDDYVNHIEYTANLVGVDHVGIGLDHTGERDFVTPDRIMEERRLFPGLTSKYIKELEDRFLESGRDRLYNYELYTPWMKSVSEVPMITEALLSRGYSDQEVKKILGENFLRVFEKVWGC
jgi:membrane dipeptidase